MLIVEARDPGLEEPGREAGLREEQDDDFDDVKSDDKESSKRSSSLIGDSGVIKVIAVLVIFVDTVADSLNILSQYNNVCNEYKEQRDHGKAAKGIEDEKLGFGGEGKHGQQVK